MNKIIKIILFYLILTAILVAFFVFHHSSIQLKQGIYLDKPQSIAPFELTDNQGNLFTQKELKNHWSLVFFGFSSCQMVCPLTMQMLNQTYESLPKTKKPQVIFISVDPDHDSLQKINQFVHQFNEHFIGLRGPMPVVTALQKQLHVTVSTIPMSHGTEILLINPEGKIQAYFYYPITSEELLVDLKRLLI